MEKKLSLPCDIVELQKMDVDWKTLTNGFDYDTVKAIINHWEKFEEQRAVIFMIYNSMVRTNSLLGRTVHEVQPVVDLIQLYRFEKGSERYNMWLRHITENEERYKREEWERLQEENRSLKIQVERLTDEKKNVVERYESLKQQIENEPREAFNQQTDKKCLTSTQMGILMQAVGELTEQRPPGKTTLGNVVENIAGYCATTVNQNMKGIHREFDKKAVAEAIESKFPLLAEKVMKL